MKITILGSGSSGGVPLIGCQCAVCQSNDPKNKRTRVSLLIEINGINLLVDTSPDLRQQALRHDIRRIDAVLYTHDHADHTNGIDDLRSFNYLSGNVLPIYGTQKTLAGIAQRFPYVFGPKPENAWYRPALSAHPLPDAQLHEFTIKNIPITMFRQGHGGHGESTGYRIGNFAYSTDTDKLSETAFSELSGLDVWIVDCLRYTHSPSHSNLDNTLKWIERAKPRKAILTHMAHDFDYKTLLAELPAGILPGFDGMIIEL